LRAAVQDFQSPVSEIAVFQLLTFILPETGTRRSWQGTVVLKIARYFSHVHAVRLEDSVSARTPRRTNFDRYFNPSWGSQQEAFLVEIEGSKCWR
jgi:hypothetical protein